MGSGKTSHGKKIARMMGYDFLDMDEWISKEESLTIPEIFESYGEKYFRQKESDAIREINKLEKVIIATGGGAPCYNENLNKLKDSGLTIYLKLSPEELLSRLKSAKTERPLLSGKNEAEMLETIKQMLAEREPFYNQADMIVDGLDGVNERVVNAIQRRSK
jgi:shikimate kinase